MHPLKKNLAKKDLFKDIANKFGTPCYLYDRNRLVDNLNNLNNALKENFKNYHICYSAKANSNPHLLKLMIDTLPDMGTDCSSPGEVFISNKVGIPGSRILYTGNYELISDLQSAYDNHCNINLDDITSIQRLQKLAYLRSFHSVLIQVLEMDHLRRLPLPDFMLNLVYHTRT